MDIRLLTEADAEEWWHMRRLALASEPAAFAESVEEHERKSVEDARNFFRANSAENFVLGYFEGGRLAGTMGYYREKHDKFRHKGVVWGVFVHKESRGKGVAKALLTEIIRRVRQVPGIEQVLLVVAAGQAAPKRVYESVGFQHYGTEPRSLKVGDKYIDDELMILYL
ncbi:MAG TPA: GNAT family N-acetyltransferase [Candidatus Limnocylindrales bacterium]|nr:GNAT family N-acetyltransferase [Candidatus Limnocylindrales bacterium]